VSAPASVTALDRLDGRPESRPWIDLLRAVRDEMTNPAYAAAVADNPRAAEDAPLIDSAELTVERDVTDRWVRGLLSLAACAGGPAATLALAARARSIDGCAVIEAAITADRARLDAIAAETGADADAMAAVAPLAAMPLLQACGRRWGARAAATWTHGYCPICAAWPAFAEARGLERARRLRCARCGGDWWIEWLCCPYCGTRDHERLGALVPDGLAERRKVETCGACRHYVKSLTTLTPTAPADVAVEDLATVELDVAALTHGYLAADGLGCAIAARVVPRQRRGWLGIVR